MVLTLILTHIGTFVLGGLFWKKVWGSAKAEASTISQDVSAKVSDLKSKL